MVPAFAGAAQLHPPARVRGPSQRGGGGGRDAGRHRAGASRRRGGPVSERQRDAALPGDVVLRLVEAVAVERVHVVTPFRPDTPAPEAVLDSRAEVAGELAPRAVRLELMDADRADAAEHVRAERPRAALDRVAEHDVRVVGELVELAAAAEARAVEAVLRPAAARTRSEEHTSELQSLAYLVCRLLLEKKKKKTEHGRSR